MRLLIFMCPGSASRRCADAADAVNTGTRQAGSFQRTQTMQTTRTPVINVAAIKGRLYAVLALKTALTIAVPEQQIMLNL